jgi:hypothetical protein
MNQIILGFIKVYMTASLIYFLYIIYLKLSKKPSFDFYLQNNEDLLNKYNKIKKHRSMVFILGVLIGLGVLVLTDDSKIDVISNGKKIINDVSDIRVI